MEVDNLENKKTRPEQLKRHELVETRVKTFYDDFTYLASKICKTPIAIISLVGSKKQWFTAGNGLNFNETSPDSTPCRHTILEDETLIIPDTAKDERFLDNDLIFNDSKIRFYAGTPLIDSERYSLGTLCVMDYLPRQLEDYQIKSLEILGRQISLQIELIGGAEEKEFMKKLLPICSYCKQVSDEEKKWHEIDNHLSKNTNLRFTHSVCPSCHEEKILPEIEIFKNLLK